MKQIAQFGIFPKLLYLQKLPNSKYNKILQLCIYNDIQSQLYYDSISFATSLKDTQTALNAVLRGFNASEFKQSIDAINYELKELKWNAKKRMKEEIHNLAFQQRLLHSTQDITLDNVQEYATKYLFPRNGVISAVGHDLPDVSHFGNKKIQIDNQLGYYGGSNKIKMDQPPILSPLDELELTHFSVVFPICGINSKQMFVFSVLSSILGGGSSFSAGGPGKGIYSRLYQLLCHVPGIEHVDCELIQYEKLSLFGITMAVESNLKQQAFTLLFSQLMRLYDIENDELERAKNQTLSKQFTFLEQSDKLCEFMGKSLKYSDKIYSNQEIEAYIRQVSKKDVKDAISQMLNCPPTCVVLGQDLKVEDPKSICMRAGIPLY
eukprot:NODE_773_length_3988_cov_0.523271.p2 type:complete len:378 gc:universal NODE_773_length_3988_cov_0.523271:2815-1682(-)